MHAKNQTSQNVARYSNQLSFLLKSKVKLTWDESGNFHLTGTVGISLKRCLHWTAHRLLNSSNVGSVFIVGFLNLN